MAEEVSFFEDEEIGLSTVHEDSSFRGLTSSARGRGRAKLAMMLNNSLHKDSSNRSQQRQRHQDTLTDPFMDNDATAVASAAADLQLFGTSGSQMYDYEEELRMRRRHRCWMFIAIASLLVAVITIPTLVFTRPTITVLGTHPTEGEGDNTPDEEQPTLTTSQLIELLSGVSVDRGVAMTNAGTPQNLALRWLDESVRDNMPLGQLLQRYSLATLYYSTEGSDGWIQNSDWLSDRPECEWFSAASVPCPDGSNVAFLDLRYNRLRGSLPPELGLLSQLRKYKQNGAEKRGNEKRRNQWKRLWLVCLLESEMKDSIRLGEKLVSMFLSSYSHVRSCCLHPSVQIMLYRNAGFVWQQHSGNDSHYYRRSVGIA